MLHGVLEVDGVMLPEVGRIEIVAGGGAILEVRAEMTPGSFELVQHDSETWEALRAQVREARAGDGSRIVTSA